MNWKNVAKACAQEAALADQASMAGSLEECLWQKRVATILSIIYRVLSAGLKP